MGKPKLGVFKFASCDGCQLSLLDCEDELLAVAGAVQIAFFPEASREYVEGPYDVTLVEGSITTPHDLEAIKEIRAQSKVLITIGACATAGGIQALRNWKDVTEFTRYVYAHPEYISTLETSTPVADHVTVDFELRGCPINKWQLIEVVNAFLHARKPNIPTYSVCVECKRRSTLVRHGGPGHPLPGPGHPGGMRRPLPGLQPGVLRVLRPDGDPQRARPGGVVEVPGSGRSHPGERPAQFQRLRPALPGGQ